MPCPCQLGLISALEQHFEVHLHIYGDCNDQCQLVWPNLHIEDASILVPWQQAQSVVKCGWVVQHVADWVRLEAIAKSGCAGWFVDVESIWVQQPGHAPSKSGHLFSLMDAPEFAFGKDKIKTMMHWLAQWTRTPGERVFLGSPWHFPAGSCVLDAVLREIRAKAAQCTSAMHQQYRDTGKKMKYRWIMSLVLDTIHKEAPDGHAACVFIVMLLLHHV